MSYSEMSHRSTGRMMKHDGNYLRRVTKGKPNRGDSVGTAVAAGGRVNATRAATVITTLEELDRAIVTTVAKARMATGRQLQRLHFGTSAADARRAGRHLKRLTELRVLGRLDRRVGGVEAGSASYVYRLDVIGQLMNGEDGRRPWHVGQAFVGHGLLVSECYVCLVEASRACGFQVADFRTEPRCWVTFTGPAGPTVLKPDAFVLVINGEFEDRWWLEVDNASEHPSRLARKAALYGQAYDLGVTGAAPFPKVLWVCLTDERTEQIAKVLRGLSEAHRDLMAVCRLDALPAVMAAGPAAAGLSGSNGGPA